MPGPFYVYEIRDHMGNVIYVGKGCRTNSNEERMHAHAKDARRGKKSKLCNRIRSIWGSGERISVQKIFASDSEADAYDFEMKEIARHGLANLCNVSLGGDGGQVGNKNASGKRSPEQIERIRLGIRKYHEGRKRLGIIRVVTQETRRKIGDSNRGKPRNISAENKARIAELNRIRMTGKKFPGRKLSIDTRLAISGSLQGKPKSSEHVEKVRRALSGRTQTLERRQLQSLALKGKPWSEKRRAAFNRNRPLSLKELEAL
jgi:hypothetical protein